MQRKTTTTTTTQGIIGFVKLLNAPKPRRDCRRKYHPTGRGNSRIPDQKTNYGVLAYGSVMRGREAGKEFSFSGKNQSIFAGSEAHRPICCRHNSMKILEAKYPKSLG